MSDQGKSAAIKILRQEVGFGCPICRRPFLTWHHFDPPWHVEQHWRPEGIIALCPICHGNADSGMYSAEELRALKRGTQSRADVKSHIPTWEDKERLLVRMGGCYTDTSGPVISVNGIPQINVGKDDAGSLKLSFELRNERDELVAKMHDNDFTAHPSNMHDMIVTPKTNEVTIWIKREDVGLRFSFKRMTLSSLDEILAQDFKMAEPAIQQTERFMAEHLQACLAPLPDELRSRLLGEIRALQSGSGEALPGLNRLPESVREAQLARDNVAYAVKRWLKDSNVKAGDTVPFLNFDEMALYFHGRRITIRDGVADFVRYCAGFSGPGGMINLECGCPACSSESFRRTQAIPFVEIAASTNRTIRGKVESARGRNRRFLTSRKG